ncbi:hypothetical protein PIB30_083851 [Stylosanthes scabra]|uniref:Uncharacterized protein n=1 Tax=Stylosanthes scabra TaxID=79078 RepID=A0ABU6QS00_9FABA|nr:hypothetical protein [Stylosanthes scabra]
MLPISASSGSLQPPLISSPMDSCTSTAAFRYVRQFIVEMANTGPSTSLPWISKEYVPRCRQLFPPEPEIPNRRMRCAHSYFSFSRFSPYLFRDCEYRLAGEVSYISYTKSCASPSPAHGDYIGTTYSVLPPDDTTRMPWSPNR